MSGVLVAIDGNSLLHRAYWAIRQMNDSRGRPTNAVYGFFRMMFRLVREYKPEYLAVAFDMHEKTFRHKVYSEYKAGRRETPDELLQQFIILKEALTMVGVKYIERPGFEADDILGTLARRSVGPNYIVTGDKDQLQLISDRTTVLMTKRGVTDIAVMTMKALMDEYGLSPGQIPDLKGLMGDASDNLPGVAGIGEKTALKLLHEYGTLDELYEHIDEMPKNKRREKLIDGRTDAFMSRDLARIDTHVDLGIELEDLAFSSFDYAGGQRLVKEYDFNSFASVFDAQQVETTGIEPDMPEPEPIGLDALAALEGDTIAAYLDGDVLHIEAGGREYKADAGGYGTPERKKLGNALGRAVQEKQFIGFDVKTLMHELDSDTDAFPNCSDCMIAAWTLDPSQKDYKMESVLRREHLAVCAGSLVELWNRQKKRIREMSLEEVYDNIEMPLMPVLYRMERNGVRVDAASLEELGHRYNEDMQRLSREVYSYAGTEFNLGSPKQLSEVLFVRLGLPPAKKTKSGYSTDISVLENLVDAHPIVPVLIEYRAVAKLKQTYVDGLLSSIRDGYVHTTFLQTATATGRLSSTDPNLQNIPVHSDMADDIRRAFPAPEGCLIVSADYSQIELRILADVADDDQLRSSFERGEDIHARTAAEILGKDISSVTTEERSHAKAINFGIVYGISDFGLSRNTGLTKAAAGRYIKTYLRRFPGVEKYMNEIKQQARDDGFVRTVYGRVRYIPEIRSSKFNVRAAGERAAMNMPIQGTAADIMKIAMIRAFDALGKLDSRLVLQVHDELIAYAPVERAAEVEEALRVSMEGAASLSVPLQVNTASGRTWLEAK